MPINEKKLKLPEEQQRDTIRPSMEHIAKLASMISILSGSSEPLKNKVNASSQQELVKQAASKTQSTKDTPARVIASRGCGHLVK